MVFLEKISSVLLRVFYALVFLFLLEVLSISKDIRINEEIRAKDVRVVDQEGKQLGIMSLREAMVLAEEKHLDLVEIAPQAKPPVCRIMDFGKHKYEQSKKDKEVKKKQKVINVKEIKMRPNIETHDFNVKIKNIVRFLKDGDKVKAVIVFRGREIVHPALGQQLLEKMASELGEQAVVERHPKLEGKNMIMILAPKNEAVAKEIKQG